MEDMKVLLASPRGFCAGVNMAIESLELALGAFGPPIYVYHEIVHNKYVVSHFRGRGVTFVDDLAEVPAGATLLFSAHGVSPEVRRIARERKLRAIDATCPLVTKVHLEAIKYADEGYTILLIGHEGHDEVIGTMGEAPEAIVLVETPEDVASLKVADESKVAYLTQTTLSVDDANRIIARLKERFPKIAAPPKDDICYATQNRQEAVSLLSARCRCGAGAGQPEQLEQPAAGGTGPRARHRGPSHRRHERHRPRLVRRRRNGARHRRRERAGGRRRRMPRLAARSIRRDGRAALDPRGERFVSVAERTAERGDGQMSRPA